MRTILMTLILTPSITSAEPALRMSAEVDPADYTVYHGWGGFVGVRPEATPHWRFRIGFGSAKLPDVAVQNTDNNDGWHQRIGGVITVAAHRYFGSGRGGFFAGPVAGWSYDLLPVIPMPQLLVGYEFDVLK